MTELRGTSAGWRTTAVVAPAAAAAFALATSWAMGHPPESASAASSSQQACTQRWPSRRSRTSGLARSEVALHHAEGRPRSCGSRT